MSRYPEQLKPEQLKPDYDHKKSAIMGQGVGFYTKVNLKDIVRGALG